jgi:hypothetical protein
MKRFMLIELVFWCNVWYNNSMAFTQKNLARILVCLGVFVCSSFFEVDVFSQTPSLQPCANQSDCQNKADAVVIPSDEAEKFAAEQRKAKYEKLASFFEKDEELEVVWSFIRSNNLELDSIYKDDYSFKRDLVFGQAIDYVDLQKINDLVSAQSDLLLHASSLNEVYDDFINAYENGDADLVFEKLDLLLTYYEQFSLDEELFGLELTTDDEEKKINITALKKQFNELQLYIKRAGESFDVLQRSKRKNMRQYRIVMEYVRTEILIMESFQQQENETFEIEEEELKRSHESILYDEIVSGIIKKREKADWSIQKEIKLYKDLITYFEKPLDNPVKELRQHTPNGDILPGTRNDEGTDFVMQNVLPGIINTILVVILSVSVLMLMAGGFMYVVSAGNTESTKKALDMITWTILGTIAAVLVFSAVKFIIGIDFTDNEDKMPAVTEVLTDDNGALIERGFETSGNPDAGAALALGTGLVVQEALEALNIIDDDIAAIDDVIEEIIDETIEITELILKLEQGQVVNNGDEIPMLGPMNQREIPNLTAQVNTNLGASETEVLEWRLQQDANSVIFEPSTETGLQAIYSALDNVTGGDYRLSVKVQKKNDPRDFVWSEPIKFVVTEGALLRTADYSVDGQNWRELRSRGEMNTIPFNYEGINFRFGIKTSWEEMIFDQTPDLTGYNGLPPTRGLYDDYSGYIETYQIDNPQSAAYTFSAKVKNGTQTEERSILPFDFDVNIDRTLNLENIDWGDFEADYLPQSNDPNTVCIKTNLGPYITIDWRIIGSSPTTVIYPIQVQDFDPLVGTCADYPSLLPGVYTMAPEIVDTVDQNNLIQVPNKTFEVRPNLTVTNLSAFRDIATTPTNLTSGEIIYLDPQFSPRKTEPLDFYIETNLASEVQVTWDSSSLNDTGNFISDLSYVSNQGVGGQFEYNTVGNYSTTATVTDQHLPSNTITVEVWDIEVAPLPITVDSMAVQMDNNNLSIGDTVIMTDPLGVRSLPDLDFQIQTNLSNYAVIAQWEVVEVSPNTIVSSGTTGSLVSNLNNLNTGIHTLRVLVQDVDFPTNQVWYSNFWFKVEEQAVVTRAEHSPDGGLTWVDIDPDQNIFPFLTNGNILRFSVDSSWGNAGVITSYLDGFSPTALGTIYDTSFGYTDNFVRNSLDSQENIIFNGVVTHAQTGETMEIPDWDFPIDSFDRSIFVLSDYVGVFANSFVADVDNNIHTACVMTNLGDTVTTQWNLVDSQLNIIVPSLIDPFDSDDGHCVVYGTLLPDDYSFTYTITDNLDPTNNVTGTQIDFVVLPALQITNTTLQYNTTPPEDILHNSLKIESDGAGGYLMENNLRVLGNTNHLNSTVMVVSAEIQDLTGNFLEDASVLGAGQGDVVAEFSPYLSLGIGEYQLVLTLASIHAPAETESVTIPFTANNFSITSTDLSYWDSDTASLLPAGTAGQVVPYFVQTDFNLDLDIDVFTDLSGNVHMSNVALFDDQGLQVALLADTLLDGNPANADLAWSNNLAYGDYNLIFTVTDALNQSDRLTVNMPIVLVTPSNIELVYTEYPNATGSNLVPFGTEISVLFKSNYYTQSDPSALLIPANNAQQVRGDPVIENNYYRSSFSQLLPGDYDLTLEIEDSVDATNFNKFTNPPASQGLDYAETAITVSNPPLMARKGTSGSWEYASSGHAGYFRNDQVIRVASAFSGDINDLNPPVWRIEDANGVVNLDNASQVVTPQNILIGNVYDIDISILIPGNDYSLYFSESNSSFNGGAAVDQDGPLTFDVRSMYLFHEDYGLLDDGVMGHLETTTLCFDTNAGSNTAIQWYMRDSYGATVLSTNTPIYDAVAGGWCADYGPFSGGYYTFDALITQTNLPANQLILPTKNIVITEPISVMASSLSLGTDPTVPLGNNTLKVSGSAPYILNDNLLVNLSTNLGTGISIFNAELQKSDGTLLALAAGLGLSTNGGDVLATFNGPLTFDDLGEYELVITVGSTDDISNTQTIMIPLSVSTFEITNVQYFLDSSSQPSAIGENIVKSYYSSSAGRMLISPYVNITTDLVGGADIYSFVVTDNNGQTLPVTGTYWGGEPAYVSFENKIGHITYGTYDWSIVVGNPNNTSDKKTIEKVLHAVPQSYDLRAKSGASGVIKLAANGHAGDFKLSELLQVVSAFPVSGFMPSAQWQIKDSNGVVVLDDTTQTIAPQSNNSNYVYSIDISALPMGHDYTLEFAERTTKYDNDFWLTHDGILTFDAVVISQTSYNGGLFATGFMLDTDTTTVCIDTDLGLATTASWNLDFAGTVISPTNTPAYNSANGGWCADYGLLAEGSYAFDVKVSDNTDPINEIVATENFVVSKQLVVTDSFISLGNSSSPIANNNVKATYVSGNYKIIPGLKVHIDTNSTESIMVTSAKIERANGSNVNVPKSLGNSANGGIVSATFFGNLNLGNYNSGLGEYKMVATVAESANTNNSQTIEIPFTVSTFEVTNIDTFYLGADYYTLGFNMSDKVSVGSLEGISPYFFGSSNKPTVGSNVEINTTKNNHVTWSASQLLDSAGSVVTTYSNQVVSSAFSGVEASLSLHNSSVQFSQSPDLYYGDYKWRIKLANSQGTANDYQWVEIPMSVVPMQPPVFKDFRYKNFNSSGATAFYYPDIYLRYKSTSFSTSNDTITFVADPSSTATTMSFDVTEVSQSGEYFSSATFKDLPPGTYTDMEVTMTDKNDPSLTTTISNPSGMPSWMGLSFPVTIAEPPLNVFQSTGTSYTGQGTNFAQTESLMIRSVFGVGQNYAHTPYFQIKDSQGALIADQTDITIVYPSNPMAWAQVDYFIPLASLPLGTNYELHFYEEIAEIANGAPIHYDGPFIFDVQ